MYPPNGRTRVRRATPKSASWNPSRILIRISPVSSGPRAGSPAARSTRSIRTSAPRSSSVLLSAVAELDQPERQSKQHGHHGDGGDLHANPPVVDPCVVDPHRA